MSYQLNKITGNKVVGISVFLAPKKKLSDYFRVKASEFQKWKDGIAAGMSKAAKDAGIDNPELVELEISHSDGAVQTPGLDDIKDIVSVAEAE